MPGVYGNWPVPGFLDNADRLRGFLEVTAADAERLERAITENRAVVIRAIRSYRGSEGVLRTGPYSSGEGARSSGRPPRKSIQEVCMPLT